MGAPHGGVGVDLISDLSDDLLVRILDLLPDARDVLRTDRLSRRWRGLWTRVTALRFVFFNNNTPELRDSSGNHWRFVEFVDGALALRRAAGNEAAVEHLAFSFDMSDYEKETAHLIVPWSVHNAQKWIHHAVQQHPVKSLVFKLLAPWHLSMPGRPVMTLDKLATSAKLEAMHLDLSYVKLKLPRWTAVFKSLTDLSLENMEVEHHAVGHLVSSECCPRLRRLRLVDIKLHWTERELMIDAGALLKLSLKVYNLESLELTTPGLKILHVKGCHSLAKLTVSAPRLEELKLLLQHHLRIDANGDLSRVARLRIEFLSSNGLFYYHDINDSSIHLLESCRLIRCLQVSLQVQKRKKQYVDMIKSWIIPQLPHVTSLTARVTLWSPHSYAAGVASLLAQCKSIRYLSLQLCCCFIKTKNGSQLVLSCDKSSRWKSHELSLAHLQEAEFTKLMGTADELQFIQFILTRASGIQKVAVSFNRDFWPKGSEEDGFKALPSVAGGSWTSCNNAYLSYKWTRCVRVDE